MDVPRLDFARGVITGAIMLAVAVNLAQFRVIEREIGLTYAALNRYESAYVADVVAAHTPTVRQRFGLYAELRRWARGAEVFVGPHSGLQRDQLAGLSGMGELHDWDGSAHELSEEEATRIAANVVTEGEDRWAGPFALAVPDRSVERLVSFRLDDTLVLVDGRLLDGFEP
jgi:hypothetical protein